MCVLHVRGLLFVVTCALWSGREGIRGDGRGDGKEAAVFVTWVLKKPVLGLACTGSVG